jgi:hypothetical protein
MSRIDPDELERRLAARVGPTLPPGLRGRVLADIHRVLEQRERAPLSFIRYALPAAAAVLVCVNLCQSLFPSSSHRSWDHTLIAPGAEPLARSLRLPPGVSEGEVQQLSFLLCANSRAAKPPALSQPLLQTLLREESSSWNSP